MARKRRPPGLVKVTLKNIRRLEKDGHGWRVNIKRRRRSHARYFPDAEDGPFESLRAAIAWRDQEWRQLGPPTHVPARSRRSTSDVVGVYRETVRDRPAGLAHWIARWLRPDGSRAAPRFSIRKHGEQEAYRQAVEARRAGVAATDKARERQMLDTLHDHSRATAIRPEVPAPAGRNRTGARKRRPPDLVKVSLKSIRRLETEGHGWRVHVVRRRKSHAQYFPDGIDGPFESLRAAITWRDDVWRSLGPPTHVRDRSRRTTSDVVGVFRTVLTTRGGGLSEHWVATWPGAAAGLRSKRSFSVNRYGEEEAFRLAVEARRAGVAATATARARRMHDVLHAHERAVSPTGRGT